MVYRIIREIIFDKKEKESLAYVHNIVMLSWWCSGSASHSWSKGRLFDSRPGLYQVN